MMNKKDDEQLNNSDGNKTNQEDINPSNWTQEFKTDNDRLIPHDEDIVIDVSDKAINKDVLKKAEAKIKEQKSKRGKWFTVAFFVINLFVLVGVLIYQYNNFGVKNLDEFLVEDKNFKYLIFAFLTFLVLMLLETLRNFVLIAKSTKTKRFALSYKSAALYRYYTSITPMSTGGQAFELVYLKSRGIRSGIATSIPFFKFILYQFAFVSLSLILIFSHNKILFDGAMFTGIIAIVTLVIIILVVLFIIFLSTSKKFAPKIILGCLKLLQKMRIIKDYNASFKKIMRFGLEYQRSIKYFASSLPTLITSFVSTFGLFLCKALIAFFIFCTFKGFDTSVFTTIFTKIILLELVVKLIPIPGGSGLSEISFTALFIGMFDNGSIFWALLIWRIFDYFIFVIQGGVVLIYDFIFGNKRNNKEQEKLKIKTKDEKLYFENYEKQNEIKEFKK